ncbi:ATP-binding protein [Chelativorans intermedius]|uniref:ATP-binding protein n=1 Tax=Chelativorans intermedius TaxID=515947 RepID=A0ABV6DB66_9HYPH|nr:ATP-binding protein [Chelativorans intermedius]MCT9000243.1 ATP-binding protein [Chelativorans intermedius]
MTEPGKEKIAFDVETSRILQILSSEIYDSPKAFLRENVQNAYDAILMRCTAQDLPVEERRIEITVKPDRLTVRDDGIGMTEDVLKNNFWKAGSSGKKSELAQRSGVIGTFGIGAMANFGVCTALRVETRHIESELTLVSSAKRDDLKIAQDCIDLERIAEDREPGTIVMADLDPANPIDESAACEYLSQYVRFLPVPVIVNGRLISQEGFEDTLAGKAKGFEQISSCVVSRGEYAGTLQVSVNGQNRVLARLTDIELNGTAIKGETFFVQDGGTTHGFRNLFGLAPVPVSGHYGFGGFVNLDILHPTAGREALSRESIQHVANLLAMVEAEVSQVIADTPVADANQQFQQYILSHGLTPLAKGVKISVRPADDMIALGSVATYEPDKPKHYYTGQDATILKRFASDQANLFHVSQANPRRKLQLRYLSQIVKLEQVPERTIVERISATQLTIEEAMFLVRLRSILLDDYLMPDVDAAFATISHGVSFHVEKTDRALQISIARGIPAVSMVLECYTAARDVFDGFMKDFVREHIYPHIRDYVPSSTKQGRDALYKRLKENKELFRIEESDYGAIESLLADYLAGKAEFSDVIRTSRSRAAVQRQHVSRAQVGSVEDEFPDIIQANDSAPPPNELEAAPPIMREDVESDMKVLTVSAEHQKLNNFKMFLAISDRMVKREGEFLRWPHTTKLIWGAHRVIYIFADTTGSISLYYDIELKSPLETDQTGGAMFPTTTIVTKNRIFIPVPGALEPAFQITDGDKEFYVRFDTIP